MSGGGWGRGGWGPCTVESRLINFEHVRGESLEPFTERRDLHDEVHCIVGNCYMGHPLNRQTDMNKNITFTQLCWRLVTTASMRA